MRRQHHRHMVSCGLEVTASILRQEFLTSALAAVPVLADAVMIRAGELNRERERWGWQALT